MPKDFFKSQASNNVFLPIAELGSSISGNKEPIATPPKKNGTYSIEVIRCGCKRTEELQVRLKN